MFEDLAQSLQSRPRKGRDGKMAWDFAGRIRHTELPEVGPFKLDKSVKPEPLVGGRFRVEVLLKSGGRRLLSTYEGTIGDIINAGGLEGWVEAFLIPNRNQPDKPYVNFKPVHIKPVKEPKK